MIKIRLQRYGAKKKPFYRMVVANSTSPRDGRFIEQLGHFDTVSHSEILSLKEERIKYWLSQGAQPSQTVGNLLKKKGLMAAT